MHLAARPNKSLLVALGVCITGFTATLAFVAQPASLLAESSSPSHTGTAHAHLRSQGLLVYETSHPRRLVIDGHRQPDLTPPIADLDVWDPTLIDAAFDTTGAPMRVQWYASDAAATAAQHRYRTVRMQGYYTLTTRLGRILVIGTVYDKAMTARLQTRVAAALTAVARSS
jgi:hypothetical protein